MSEIRKSVVFQGKFDMSELPKAVQDMKRMMDQAQVGSRLSQQGFGNNLVPKPEDIQKSKVALEQSIRMQTQHYEMVNRLLEKRKSYAEYLNNIDTKSMANEREKEKIIARRIEAQERVTRAERAQGSNANMLKASLDAQRGDSKTINEMLTGVAKKFVMPAVIAAVVGATAKAITQYAALPREITTATGAATQGLIGTPLQNMQSDLIKSVAFKKEWGESLGMASKERERANFGGAARLGSINGLVGRYGEDIASVQDMIGKRFHIKNLGGMTRSLTNPFEEAYQAQQGQQQAQRAQEIYAAKLQSDPLKMAAVNKYSQNYMRDLQAQRMMGLSDQGYFGKGGFQERMNRGFNEELGLGMAQQIQGAGGSTRAMGGNAYTGLSAQRGFDLTNAGSILGKISGGAGSSGATDKVFWKLMEESIKGGLDKSEFREEQRRFVETAADIVSGAGARTGEDAAAAMTTFMRGMGGEPTIRGIQGAAGANEQIQGLTSQTSGRMGAMQMASFMKNPQLRKLGAAGMGELMRIPEQNMIASNEDIIGAAAEIGGDMTPDKLASTLKQMKRNDMLLTLGLDPTEINAFANSPEGKAFRASGGKDMSLLNRSQKATWRKIQKQSQFGTEYKNPYEQNALNLSLMGGEAGGTVPGFGANAGTPEGAKAYEEYLTKMSGGGRMADTAVTASGQVSQEFLENFREFSKAITPSTEAVSEWTKQLILSATVLRYTAAGNQAAAIKAMSDANANNAINGGQPQVTTPEQ